MYSVKVLRSADEFEAIRSFWEDNAPHPNAELEFYSTVIQSRSEIIRPHVIAISNDGQIVSLLVGRIERDHRRFRFGYMNLKIGKANSLVIVYGGCVGLWNTEIATLVSEELSETLRRKEAAIIQLESLAEDAPLMLSIRQELVRHRPHRFEAPNRHWKMKVAESLEDFMKKFKSKQRTNLRRERKLYEEKYGEKSEFRCFTKEDDVIGLMDDIERVAKDSYHRRLGFGFMHNEETLNLMRLRARRGWLHTYVLYIDGISVAFWQGAAVNGTLYLGSTAYDNKISDCKPGKLVLQYMVEDLAANSDIREVDFGFGDAYYKKQFGDICWEEISATIYSTSLPGLYFAGLEIGSAKAHHLALNTLNRFGGLEKVKKLWRNLGRTPKPSPATED